MENRIRGFYEGQDDGPQGGAEVPEVPQGSAVMLHLAPMPFNLYDVMRAGPEALSEAVASLEGEAQRKTHFVLAIMEGGVKMGLHPDIVNSSAYWAAVAWDRAKEETD